jgi:hypothetical protein
LRHAVAAAAGPYGYQDYLLTDNFTVAFDAAAPYWLDTAVVEQAAAEMPLDALLEAVAAYRGELLPGFYAEWVGLERERLHMAFERQMQALLDRLGEAGRWADVLAEAERWRAGAGARTGLPRLMLAHSGQGDGAGVAQALPTLPRRLARDLARGAVGPNAGAV